MTGNEVNAFDGKAFLATEYRGSSSVGRRPRHAGMVVCVFFHRHLRRAVLMPGNYAR